MSNTEYAMKIETLAGWLKSAETWKMTDLVESIQCQIASVLASQMNPQTEEVTTTTDPVTNEQVTETASVTTVLPASPKATRKAKNDTSKLVTLHSSGLFDDNEPCHITSNGHRVDYTMCFENGMVRWLCRNDGIIMTSPLQVSTHHSSQIYSGHNEPTKPGNGWSHIKLTNRGNVSLDKYCKQH